MTVARLHVQTPLAGAVSPFPLPAAASRHAQVLRLQPGSALTLFDGHGGEWQAEVVAMSRKSVEVRLVAHRPVEREAARAVTLAVAMPSNDRMDDLVEKATELGAVAIVPLLAERSVLRLAGERAERRQVHWQQVAVAACEQCGRNRVPAVRPVQTLAQWLAGLPAPPATEVRVLLGWRGARSWGAATAGELEHLLLLSGPEGGLSPEEEALAARHGFTTACLGPRVLRADTAPLAALASLVLREGADGP